MADVSQYLSQVWRILDGLGPACIRRLGGMEESHSLACYLLVLAGERYQSSRGPGLRSWLRKALPLQMQAAAARAGLICPPDGERWARVAIVDVDDHPPPDREPEGRAEYLIGLRMAICTALRGLPLHEREVIQSHCLERQSLRQTARRVRRSQERVRQQVQRALIRLRKSILRDYAEDWE